MGILPAQALATTVVCNTEYTWRVPDTWSLKEAATVPVDYATAYYALVMRGRIRRGDKVHPKCICPILPKLQTPRS
jgi:fatty acid synthase